MSDTPDLSPEISPEIDETAAETGGRPSSVGSRASADAHVDDPVPDHVGDEKAETLVAEEAAAVVEATHDVQAPPPAQPAIAPTPPKPSPPKAAQPAQPLKAKKKSSEGESWIETIKTIVYALLIALVIRTFLFQPFNIPSGSMEDTLLIGDYLFVEKYSYGYSRYSFPYGIVPFPGRVFGSQPARGDVVVFKFPQDNSTDYIKRVIGLPGDRVQMLNGQLYINEKPVPKVRVGDYVETSDGIAHNVPRYRETLPNGKSYLVLDRFQGAADNTDVYVVPADHYFMMGDNRDNSNDSRGDVGYVPKANLVGKAELIFFSTDGSARFWEFWKWPWAVRYNRMFTVID
ncbi:MAG: signal peptidase I [Proteobacteria bacterium]|nr:signal peptidase I [Pseudomonadota bacterium]